ncbi:putative sugar kinase [Octadecabacter antarcticus 307]|uniref:Putative sugar kinase n=1 Tax=Octadecabacter antarcticus 307 TaxID=391626 RepID=M9RAG8_9RHOB|nr:carbohydrate kinase family protein [Octadecabacter antarcticus]AGI69644.1 putative sugar kinase [Octadecabacter antarcticus 307]
MRKPILCAGRLYCDMVFADAPRLPTLGTEVFAPNLSLHAGGGAFITGATLAALGYPVRQFSNLPATPFDTIVLADMAAHDVDATACKPADNGIDPQITVAIATAGDRAFLTRAAGQAIPDFSAINFADFAHLHIGELRTLQDSPALLDHARAAGLTVSLDCGWQDSYDPDVTALIAAVDVFLPNESEIAALALLGIPQTCARLTVVKSGHKGARARLIDDSAWTNCAVKSPVQVRDATGAGDAFNAGFLSRWLEHAPLRDCLAKGNACGSAAVQIVGGIGFPQHV